jgi:hypothetical protein
MKLLTTLVLLIISSFVCGQNSFTKAIIYKPDGSKIDCYIKNTTSESTQQVFNYSLENGGKTIQLDVNSISRVEFADGMILERHTVNLVIMNKPLLERRITDYEFEENKFNGDVMVEKIMTGPYSLYQFVDRHGFSHFYYTTNNDTKIEKLEYKIYVAEDSASHLPGYYKRGSDLVQKRDYRNQLLFLANNSGCEMKLTPEINRADYKLIHLVPVFKKINNCAGQAPQMNNKYVTSEPKLRITANAGAAATSLTIPNPNQTNYPGLQAESFSSSIGPLLGVSFELVPQKRQKNYVLSLDALYHSYSAKTDSLRPNSYTTGIGKFKFAAISFAPVIRFRLTKSIIAPFIEAGFSYRFLSKKEDNYYYKNSISGQERNREIFFGKSNTIGYLAGAGVDFKKFSIHARYTLPANRSTFHYSTIFVMAKFAVFGNTE